MKQKRHSKEGGVEESRQGKGSGSLGKVGRWGIDGEREH